jgi:hypothetical protein
VAPAAPLIFNEVLVKLAKRVGKTIPEFFPITKLKFGFGTFSWSRPKVRDKAPQSIYNFQFPNKARRKAKYPRCF